MARSTLLFRNKAVNFQGQVGLATGLADVLPTGKLDDGQAVLGLDSRQVF